VGFAGGGDLATLDAFSSAWNARMSSTKRRVQAQRAHIRFFRDAYYTANQREEGFPLLLRL